MGHRILKDKFQREYTYVMTKSGRIKDNRYLFNLDNFRTKKFKMKRALVTIFFIFYLLCFYSHGV